MPGQLWQDDTSVGLFVENCENESSSLSFQSSSIDFLASQGFDFNKVFCNGEYTAEWQSDMMGSAWYQTSIFEFTAPLIKLLHVESWWWMLGQFFFSQFFDWLFPDLNQNLVNFILQFI